MRTSLVVLALFLASASASAQVSVGLRAGFSGARVSPIEGVLSPNAFRPGVAIGAFADVPVWRAVSVRPEVLYVQKGSRSFSSSFDFDFDTGETTFEEMLVERRADYVEVPVLAHVTSPAGGRFRVGLMAGPAVAFRTFIGASIDRRVNGESAPYPPGTIAVVVPAPRVDVGLVAGGEVGMGPLALDLRYTAGLREVDGPSSRFKAVAVALSYRFGLPGAR